MVRFFVVSPPVDIPKGEPSVTHQHDFWQLDRIVKGATDLETTAGLFPIPAGTVVLVAPHIPHAYHFNQTVTIETVKFQSPLKLSLERGWWSAVSTGERRDLLTRLFAEWQTGGRHREAICAHYLELFLLRTAEGDLLTSDPAMEEIAPLLLKGLSPAEAAARYELSPGHFTERFKKAFGVTPPDWVRRHHIEEAKRLLHFSRDTLEEIARKIGYANVYAFSKAFKRIALTSPARFRKMREG